MPHSPSATDVSCETAAHAEPARRSTWGLAANVKRVVWAIVWTVLWRFIPRPWHRLRVAILRVFGASIGRGVAVDPTARITIPWHLNIGDGSRVGEGAILYCLGRVTIGRACLIGPYAHVCAGTHDYTTPAFTLIRAPITIEDECVIMAAAFLAPGVVVARGGVVRERAGVYRNTKPDTVYEGNPAKALGPRSVTLPEERTT